MISSDNIAAVILAGGRGSRMGGQDKGLINFQGQPLINHPLALAERHAQQTIISANRNIDIYKNFGLTVVTDTHGDFSGPLAGLSAGVNAHTKPWTLLLPCDAPFIHTRTLELLRQCAPPAGCYATARGQDQYLVALLPTCINKAIENALSSGVRSMKRFYQINGVISVDVDTGSSQVRTDQFLNMNTVEDLNVDQIDSDLPSS